MEPLKQLLFEQPYVQLAIEAAALLVALAGWWWARREGSPARSWGWALLAILAGSIAGQALQWAIVTDRERIRGMMDQIAVAVEQEDIRTLTGMVDPSLVWDGRTADEWREWLAGVFRQADIHTPRVSRFEVEFPTPNTAIATVTGIATVQTQGFRQMVTGAWQIDLQRIDGQWKITAGEAMDGLQLP